MIDIQLDQGHDIELINGDMILVKDANEVTQSVKIRILTLYLEWYFNATLGIRWFGENGMFDPKTSVQEKEFRIKKVILSAPGLQSIIFFNFSVDPINRGAYIEFTATTIYGKIEIEVTV